MDWRDQGILLNSRRHGESSVIIEVFTPERGRHAGVVRGGASRKMAPVLQPGAQLDLEWRARLEDHIGTFRVEPLKSRAWTMGDRMALAGLNAVCALLLFVLPEREAHAELYRKTLILLDILDQPEIWTLAYLNWEMALLEEMGFGLDLRRCAVLGEKANDLSYISPKTGRAVSRAGAGEWANRLLPLPPCLMGHGPAPDAEILQGFEVTGHFLNNHLAPQLGNRALPEARARYVARFAAEVAKG
ncbi:DNA repair protein RecO [Roseovarius mucosus]|uniref:DNA repair protein RecO n=1 Tax=Roseovarius mucosus TaxID=215743 RepID=A0A1V0RM28_9RHOB|nr:DNA repair protein RecO [Roseovarius mucosus]ARE82817.1 DNA repair protein RecO [Roseovarius mucosus]